MLLGIEAKTKSQLGLGSWKHVVLVLFPSCSLLQACIMTAGIRRDLCDVLPRNMISFVRRPSGRVEFLWVRDDGADEQSIRGVLQLLVPIEMI